MNLAREKDLEMQGILKKARNGRTNSRTSLMVNSVTIDEDGDFDDEISLSL